MRKWIIPFLLCLLCLLPIQVLGASAPSQESNIHIEIVDNPLTLEVVSVPRFKERSEKDVGQVLEAENDFVVVVQDKRKHKGTPWRLTYQLTPFDTPDATPITLRLDKGRLVTPKGTGELSYKGRAANVVPGESQQLITAYSTKAERYEYRIPKEGIRLDIKTGLSAGTYTAKQTVTLINTPEAN